MSAINPDEIISILKEEIENYDEISQNQEVGTVISVGDGIATVYGIDHAMYGEVVVFENGLKGMVQDIRTNSMGCILFGKDTGIKEGTKVTRTGKQAGIPVGNGYVGRIVNALGAPIDGKGEIKEEGYRPVENPAPGIIDRKSVTVPLETGILSLDSMFPIGCGQRELIMDRRHLPLQRLYPTSKNTVRWSTQQYSPQQPVTVHRFSTLHLMQEQHLLSSLCIREKMC